MMAGAFLGWQIAVLALFVGALSALALKLASLLFVDEGAPAEDGKPAPDARELPFGPGLAIGIVLTWFVVALDRSASSVRLLRRGHLRPRRRSSCASACSLRGFSLRRPEVKQPEVDRCDRWPAS